MYHISPQVVGFAAKTVFVLSMIALFIWQVSSYIYLYLNIQKWGSRDRVWTRQAYSSQIHYSWMGRGYYCLVRTNSPKVRDPWTPKFGRIFEKKKLQTAFTLRPRFGKQCCAFFQEVLKSATKLEWPPSPLLFRKFLVFPLKITEKICNDFFGSEVFFWSFPKSHPNFEQRCKICQI